MMERLARLAIAYGLQLTPEQQLQFRAYQLLLLEWNQRLNLTAITEPDEIVVRHFLDALTCTLATRKLGNEQRLVDVGTGAGFPGLPLKIIFPELHLTLVESVRKKCTFLEAVVDELGLDHVTVLAERAEDLGQDMDHREQYDWAVARSVAELRVLVEYLLPLCRLGGAALAQKGAGVEEELLTAGPAIQRLGGGTPQLQTVSLPGREQPHYLVTIPKERLTPAQYPRRAGMPAKRPL